MLTNTHTHTHTQELHNNVWNPEKLDLLEYVGKNAGARRARGRFLLMMNQDDIISEEMIKTLAGRQLDSRVMYVTFRGDVEGTVPTDMDVTAEDMLRYVCMYVCMYVCVYVCILMVKSW